MRAYREILSIPGALRFSAAGLLARSGGAMMGLGIVLMVSALYGSYGLAGALVRARWSHVTSDANQLHAAFSLESTLDEVTFVVGPVLATALSTGVHPAAGLVAPVILSLLGAQLFYSQRATEPPVAPRPEPGTRRPAALRRFILLTPGVAAIVVVNLLIGCVFGGMDVSVVAATTDWGFRSASGAVLAVFSGASGVAGLLYGARHWRSPLPGRFATGVVALFIATLGLFLAASVLVLAAIGVLVGLTVAPTLINGNTLIGRLVLRERLTEGLAWMGTGIGIGVAVGSSITGGVIDTHGYPAGFGVVTGFAALAAAIALASLASVRRAERRVSAADDPDGTRDTVFE